MIANVSFRPKADSMTASFEEFSPPKAREETDDPIAGPVLVTISAKPN